MSESVTTPTVTATLPDRPVKRCAIVGTAPTWRQTPWADLTLDVFSLNDAYVLGLPRATAWFDLHPIAQMAFVPKGQNKVSVHAVPIGAYLRPEGHLDWLKTRPFPIYLAQARPDWPHSQAFPFEAMEAKYGHYFGSTPAWMLAWALEQGYTEIHIYGIHLATEWEYRQQRPNLEFLIGIALARGVSIVIPDRSPLLKSKYRYALEPKPEIPLDRVRRRLDQIRAEGAHLHQALAHTPWYARGRKKDLRSRLAVVDIELLDAQVEWRRASTLYQIA